MLLLDEFHFLEAFGRDVDFYDIYPQTVFLDLETGDLLWHYDILQEFLYSDWSADEETRRRAQKAYFGSIGGWKRAVADDDVVRSFYSFREIAIKSRAEQFLREHGVRAGWK